MITAFEVLNEAGLVDTYWGEQIIKAENKGRFTKEDRDKANGWTTCACGNITANIPRLESGAPKDETLQHLGFEFWEAVENHYFVQAARILVRIEIRVAILT